MSNSIQRCFALRTLNRSYSLILELVYSTKIKGFLLLAAAIINVTFLLVVVTELPLSNTVKVSELDLLTESPVGPQQQHVFPAGSLESHTHPLRLGVNNTPLGHSTHALHKFETVRRSSHSQRNTTTGYVLTLRFSGQQGSAVKAIVSQQCWIKSFQIPSLVVEPFIINSLFLTMPHSLDSGEMKFSEYYDIDHYNDISESEGYAQMAKWDEFVETASRELIVVVMNRAGKNSVIWEGEEGNHSSKCYPVETDKNTSVFAIYHDHIKALQKKYSFCVVRVVASPYRFQSAIVFNDTDVNRFIFGRRGLRNRTLLFTTWRGRWFAPNPYQAKPDTCKSASENSDLITNLFSSSRMRKAAKRYEELYLKGRPASLAVMLRTERMLYALRALGPNSDMKMEFNKCLRDVVLKAKDLGKSGTVFTAVDIGTYGSNTWNLTSHREIQNRIGLQYMFQVTKEIIGKIFNPHMAFEDWENTFIDKRIGGINDRGFVAALQKSIATRADCLILLGGGNFLHLALREYLHNHPDPQTWCVQMVCVMSDRKKGYQRTLDRARKLAITT